MSDVKPDWSEAPEWANYWAVDDTGCAYWYEERPILRYGEWRPVASSYEFDKLLAEKVVHSKGFNYMDSLHKRPLAVNPAEALEFAMHIERPAETVEINPVLCSDEEEDWNDAVNPSHYKNGKVECIDAIESATVGKIGLEAVCTANTVKYLWRYETKNGLEDVKKAQWYLNRLVEHLESKEI